MSLDRVTIERCVAVWSLVIGLAACSAAPADPGMEQLTPDGGGVPPTGLADAANPRTELEPPTPDVGQPVNDAAVTPDATTSDGVAEDTTTPEEDATGPVEDVALTDAQDPEDTAGADALVEDGQQGEPDVPTEETCEPGTVTCDGQLVVVCSPEGNGWATVATCPESMTCYEGSCCSAACEGKDCGDDGCGGSCGSCAPGWSCDDGGTCEPPPPCEGEGEGCDDGDPCTVEDLCVTGQCLGTPMDCGDDDPCTETGCDSGECFAKPTVCEDGDPCTHDGCDSNGCFFKPVACDDGVPCTIDSCEGGVCTHALAPGMCLIEGACVESGAVAPDNPCLICAPGQDSGEWTSNVDAVCDDGDLCTVEDVCVLGDGGGPTCVGTSLVTPNDDPCTTVVCDGGAVSSEVVDGASCEPDDPCATSGTCAGGSCVPDDPCECLTADDCKETEVCVDTVCVSEYCGNGVCEDGEGDACPEDCGECVQAAWCNDSCGSELYGEPLCVYDCCGDGQCQPSETKACCPEDCNPGQACEAAVVLSEVPTVVTGDTSTSNAVVSGMSGSCEENQGFDLINVAIGEGPEDIYRFVAPFTGSFDFELASVQGSDFWFFTSCDQAEETCVMTADYDFLNGGMEVSLELEEGEAIYIAVDASTVVYGTGEYSLFIDGECTPACEDKGCGDDGCGGVCGTCNDASICSPTGQCVSGDVLCTYHLDCDPHQVCAHWPTLGLNRCSGLCNGPSQCSNDRVCARVPGSGHIAYCRDPGDLLEAGESCASDDACMTSLCINGTCHDACVRNSGCSGGQVCRLIDRGDTMTSVCVDDVPTIGNDLCSSCATAHCDQTGSGAPCADLCSTTNDCGDDQACNAIAFAGAPNPATVPYSEVYDGVLYDAILGCYTPPEGLGDNDDGEQCFASSDCETGVCLPLTGTGDAYYCTRPCRSDGHCEDGMTCRLTGVNMYNDYLVAVGAWDTAAYSLVRFCDFE